MKKDWTIRTSVDVARFITYMVLDLGVDVNPDDPFGGYANKEGEPTFSDKDAEYYDSVMEDCHKVCSREQKDIYEITMRVLALFHYCNGNDTMQKFYDNWFIESEKD